MKTIEFVKKVKELADKVITIWGSFGNLTAIQIYKSDNIMITVWTDMIYAIDTMNGGYSVPREMSNEVEELYKPCFEYASTPVNEREK